MRKRLLFSIVLFRNKIPKTISHEGTGRKRKCAVCLLGLQ